MFTDLEREIYDIPYYSQERMKEIEALYKKLNISKNTMTLKGFIIAFKKELDTFNLNNIKSFEQLCKKSKKYRKFIKRRYRWID